MELHYTRTSKLPAVAAYKKNTDIAIGNVVGSNIFNSFWILGLSSVLNPIPVLQRNNIDFAMNILASVLLFTFLYWQATHAGKMARCGFILVFTLHTLFI
ncbi:MAG: hypothetical protein IPL22_04555 [Bacteroidetes bacterium]|nr:hypothetical protein [Bacteroidota bacterium]